MWPIDRVETEQRYSARWQEHGYDPRTLGWNKDCQWVRFQAALEGLSEHDYASILDVGCGFGDFLTYLRRLGWGGVYLGVDIVDELIDEARRLHADDELANFVHGDINELDTSQTYAAAVSIGVFNHMLHQRNEEFVGTTMRAMWALTSNVIVCDFLSSSAEVRRRRGDLYYADPRVMYDLASTLSRRIMIHHGYMPFEFQVKVWHDDSFAQSAPVFPPYADLAAAQTELSRARRSGERP
jgi:SAM-dependent methyltransferase